MLPAGFIHRTAVVVEILLFFKVLCGMCISKFLAVWRRCELVLIDLQRFATDVHVDIHAVEGGRISNPDLSHLLTEGIGGMAHVCDLRRGGLVVEIRRRDRFRHGDSSCRLCEADQAGHEGANGLSE